MSRVLVTGGTGICGRAVVARLLDQGHEVRVLSRRERPRVPDGVGTVRGDLRTGAGLAEATAGVETIVHCASATELPLYGRARRVDVEGTSRLIEAARAGAGSPHLVYISIVGIDRIPLGYYKAKLQAEKVIQASGFPHTILRTTQFHEFIVGLVQRQRRLPAVIVPKHIRFQPVDVGEVADRLAACVAAGPRGRLPDLGGPEVHNALDLVISYLIAAGERKPVFSLYIPGAASRAFREGANLVAEGELGRVRWEDWLRHLTSGD